MRLSRATTRFYRYLVIASDVYDKSTTLPESLDILDFRESVYFSNVTIFSIIAHGTESITSFSLNSQIHMLLNIFLHEKNSFALKI